MLHRVLLLFTCRVFRGWAGFVVGISTTLGSWGSFVGSGSQKTCKVEMSTWGLFSFSSVSLGGERRATAVPTGEYEFPAPLLSSVLMACKRGCVDLSAKSTTAIRGPVSSLNDSLYLGSRE